MQKERNNDKWVKNGMMFICDGNGCVVTPSLQTVCIGPVDEEGNVLEDVYKRIENASLTEEGVAKLDTNTKPLKNDIQARGYATSGEPERHPGGRPLKVGPVHRTTKWRRQRKKKEQLAMAL